MRLLEKEKKKTQITVTSTKLFHIIIIIIIIIIVIYLPSCVKQIFLKTYSRLLGEETSGNHRYQAYRRGHLDITISAEKEYRHAYGTCARSLVYTRHDLRTKNENVKRKIVHFNFNAPVMSLNKKPIFFSYSSLAF